MAARIVRGIRHDEAPAHRRHTSPAPHLRGHPRFRAGRWRWRRRLDGRVVGGERCPDLHGDAARRGGVGVAAHAAPASAGRVVVRPHDGVRPGLR